MTGLGCTNENCRPLCLTARNQPSYRACRGIQLFVVASRYVYPSGLEHLVSGVSPE